MWQVLRIVRSSTFVGLMTTGRSNCTWPGVGAPQQSARVCGSERLSLTSAVVRMTVPTTERLVGAFRFVQ